MSSERGERLGVALKALGLVREPAADALAAAEDTNLLTDDEWEAWRSMQPDDRDLVLACLAAEFELRERQWEALEFYLHVPTRPRSRRRRPRTRRAPPGRAPSR